MTIDDENSIYVGGLPYDITEDALRRAFDLYGAVVAVKIINDREVGGKCYGFVTFTNPRSAVDAIMDMNGRTIGGRVVRVNEVRTRGARPYFHRENFRRDAVKDGDWDRGRDRERDYIRDRGRYRDRNNDDRERERDYEHDFDRVRDYTMDRSRDREDHDQEHSRDHDHDQEREHNMDVEHDKEIDRTKDHDGGRNKEQLPRNRLGLHFNDRRSRELSSNSSDDFHDQVKEQLDISIQRREELQKELGFIEEKVEMKQKLISDLEKKSQKLEDALAAARKLSFQRQSMLTKLHRCFLQTHEYAEKLKSSEQELQILVDAAMSEVDGGLRDGNGQL